MMIKKKFVNEGKINYLNIKKKEQLIENNFYLC